MPVKKRKVNDTTDTASSSSVASATSGASASASAVAATATAAAAPSPVDTKADVKTCHACHQIIPPDLEKKRKEEEATLFQTRLAAGMERAKKDPTLFQPGDVIRRYEVKLGDVDASQNASDAVSKELYAWLTTDVASGPIDIVQFEPNQNEIAVTTLAPVKLAVWERFRNHTVYKNFAVTDVGPYQVERLVFETCHYADPEYNTGQLVPRNAACRYERHPVIGMYKGSYFSTDGNRSMYERYWCYTAPNAIRQVTSVITEPIRNACIKYATRWDGKDSDIVVCMFGFGWKV